MPVAFGCELGQGEVLAVTAHARIHCALLNTSGLFGRVDGGIGFAVDEPRWEIELGRPEALGDSRLPREIATAIHVATSKARCLWNIPPFEVRVKNSIDAHAGLGSKTAILLAIGHAASILSGRRLSASSIARIFGRGGTSGIGVNCFSRGGLVWDAGHAFAEKGFFVPSSRSLAPPPKPIVHLPVRWLSVVHFRFAPSGLHGERERRAFSEWCPTSDAGTVRGLVAVSSLILPGLLERREELVHRGLKKLQDTGFKKIEWEHQDLMTKAFRAYWAALKEPEALCLSSFGPTMYVLTTNPRRVLAKINEFGEKPVHLTVTKISNLGCQVRKELRDGGGHFSSVLESTSIESSVSSGAALRMLKRFGTNSATG